MKNLITKSFKAIAITTAALSFNALQVASASDTLQLEDMGHIAYVQKGEDKTQLPISTTVSSTISEEVVLVEVSQSFVNTGEADILAEYYFPAPENAEVTDLVISNSMPCEGLSYSVYLPKDETVTVSYKYQFVLPENEVAKKHLPNVLGFQAVTSLGNGLDKVELSEIAEQVAQK